MLKPRGAMPIDQDWDTLVIAGSERDLTRAVVRTMSDSVVNGWAGRYQGATLRSAGFSETKTEAVGVSLPYRTARSLLLLPALEEGKLLGTVWANDACRFLAHLQEAEECGKFYCGFTLFASTGVKPDANA